MLLNDAPLASTSARLLAGALGLWLAIAGLATIVLVTALALTVAAAGRGTAATPEVAVFPQPAAPRDQVAALRGEIAALPGVIAARVVAGEAAVDEALQRAGGRAPAPPVRKGLVPDFIVVQFDATLSAAALERAVESLRGLARVEAVVGDLDWFRQWETVREQTKRAARALGALAGLLAIAALLAASALFARAAASDGNLPGSAGSRSGAVRRSAGVGGGLFGLAMLAAIGVVKWVDGLVQGAWAGLAPLVVLEGVTAPDSPAAALGMLAAAVLGGAIVTAVAGWLAHPRSGKSGSRLT